MRWKSGALFVTGSLLISGSALSQSERDKAEIRAASRARTCYVDLADGQLKCGGRPRRSLAEARKLLAPGSLVKSQELKNCKAPDAVWVFKWRGLPTQPPLAVDAQTGKVIECGQ
jgi:hypothetical protein